MKKQKNSIIILILILIPVTLAVVYNVKKYTKPASKCIFYKVEKNGKYLYLGGTIHLGKDGESINFSKSVENAYKESSALGVEVNLTDAKAMTKYGKASTYPKGDNLYKHISPAAKNHIEPIMNRLGLKLDTYKNDNLIYVASLITAEELSYSHISASKGIDSIFMSRAKVSNKKIIPLESMSTQLKIAAIGGDTYQNCTLETIPYEDDVKKQFDTRYNAVINGNTSYFDKIDLGKNSKDKFKSELYNLSILQVNNDMCTKIENYIKSGKKYFIVVGTEHVLGPDGLIKMLKSKGYKVTRL
ncbi:MULTISPECIES: TraB/GumN family protein [Clostridium]|uniref:TraB/GumN family protein n=1 Tax=Clostridium TaxID=1485 RepID=UPI000826A877|nr:MULTISPECIES: TraB/GumN family protein [Clostridium]PJI09075.1 hypothetical protein CUB90_14890 [Clostridium sp. CT7]